MQRAIGIERIKSKVATYALRNTDVLSIRSILQIALIVQHQEAQTSIAVHSIKRIHLIIDIIRRLASSGEIAGELAHITPKAVVLTYSLLSRSCNEVCCGNSFYAVLNEEDFAILHRILCNLSLRVIDVGLLDCDIMVAIAFKITTACRHKETIDRKEVRKVFLSHFTNLSNELQTRFVRVDIFPLRLYSVCSQSLEEFGIEGSVLLCKMIIEIEGMEHSETTVVDIPPIERFAPSKLLHSRTQRFACSCSVTHEPTIHIGKEVVTSFGKALQHNGELMLMSELVRSTSFVVIRDIRIQESLRGVERNMNAELVCMSYRTWRIVIHIRGIVEVAGIESISATQIPRGSGFLTICHRLVDAEEVVLPNRKAVQTCNCFVDFVRIGFLQD